MQSGERFAERRAIWRARPAYPHAVEEGDDCGRLSGEPAQNLAVAVLHRLRAGDAAPRQMLHQPEKERQIAFGDASLVERENVMAAAGMDEKIRILDPFGNAFIRQQLADVVGGKEAAEVFR